jgi:branched-chain amino acid transport system ATP-binding protein
MFTIAGILRARQGSVKLKATELWGSPRTTSSGRGVVLVPENRLVFPDMTVRENLLAGAYLRLSDRPAVDRRHRGDDGALSPPQGARQPERRHPVGRRAADAGRGARPDGRPRILLMDEPSLGLAPLIVEEIFQVIGDLRAEGRTILLVEQNAHMALKHADKFYLLEQGQVTFEGTPGELEQDEVIRRAYLGSAKAG